MAEGAPDIRAGLRRAVGPAPPTPLSGEMPSADSPLPHDPAPIYGSVERLFKNDTERADALKIIPPWIVKKAWFALAHLLLEPGATIVDIGCRDGAMAYTMAILAPNMNFIGLDKNNDTITTAAATYQLPNLEFQQGDILDHALSDGMADAVICNFVLHEIFSSSDFNQRLVRQTLRECGKILKPGGHLFLRDFAEPVNADELVLMEMPDMPSKSTQIEGLSEPDLLIWYSEYATMQDEPGASGFFLEELPPRFPRTRLFRLPHKWAYEFIMRKDARAKWQAEVPKEYTFFNEREYYKTLNTLGLRVLYSAPHWDDTHIKKHFEKNFRLMDENGTPLGNPATSFSVLAQKIDARDSLLLTERRKSKNQDSSFHVTTYRNDVDGRLIEVVSRDINTTEIIPFTIMNGNRLVVYLHEGVPRGLVNAVPRGGRNLDGKFWCGHLTEAIAVDSGMITEIETAGITAVNLFMQDALGLKVSVGQSLVAGPGYFPNPRFIAERIETRFISVEPMLGRYIPGFVRDDIRGFASTGAIKAFDAQSILNAISVGALPSGNLEMQLLMLFSMLDINVTDWSETPMLLTEDEPIKNMVKVSDILKRTSQKDNRYKEIRGGTGKIKLEKSIFVDENMDVDGINKGLAARDVDFAVNEDSGMNVAVILPLSKQQDGEVMAGVIIDFMPIPQRYQGNGEMITLPTLNLPREIQNMDMARRFIAEKFEIKIEQVAKMGEPYFSHISMTPQRIFPFAINAPHSKMAKPSHGTQAYAPMRDLSQLHWKGLFERYDCDLLKVTGRVNKRNFSQVEMGINWGFDMPMVEKYANTPFTTGAVVDMRMSPGMTHTASLAPAPMRAPKTPEVPVIKNKTSTPLTQAAMSPPPAAQQGTALPSSTDKIKAGDVMRVYTGGFAFNNKKSSKSDTKSGSGGKTSGGKSGSRAKGSRDIKPGADPTKKKPSNINLPQPEPKN